MRCPVKWPGITGSAGWELRMSTACYNYHTGHWLVCAAVGRLSVNVSFSRKAGGGDHYVYWMLCHGPGLVSIGSTSVDTRNVYCRRQRSKFCIERYSGCVVSTICDTLCFVIKTQTILSGHTEVPVFCVDYSRPAGKEGGGATCIPERKSDNSKETATCTESDRFPDFCLT